MTNTPRRGLGRRLDLSVPARGSGPRSPRRSAAERAAEVPLSAVLPEHLVLRGRQRRLVAALTRTTAGWLEEAGLGHAATTGACR